MLPELHLAEWRATKDTLHLYGPPPVSWTRGC